jgi:hypothetical protein
MTPTTRRSAVAAIAWVAASAVGVSVAQVSQPTVRAKRYAASGTERQFRSSDSRTARPVNREVDRPGSSAFSERGRSDRVE